MTVTGFGVPPEAGTCIRAFWKAGANTRTPTIPRFLREPRRRRPIRTGCLPQPARSSACRRRRSPASGCPETRMEMSRLPFPPALGREGNPSAEPRGIVPCMSELAQSADDSHQAYIDGENQQSGRRSKDGRREKSGRQAADVIHRAQTQKDLSVESGFILNSAGAVPGVALFPLALLT